MATVTIRYWAAAKEAAGTAEETVDAETLSAALATATAKRSGSDGRFAAVLARSSFLVDGQQAGHKIAGAFTLWDRAVIEVLPPFAGG
jgi:molybdopterin synthase sulfur carrier subunit